MSKTGVMWLVVKKHERRNVLGPVLQTHAPPRASDRSQYIMKRPFQVSIDASTTRRNDSEQAERIIIQDKDKTIRQGANEMPEKDLDNATKERCKSNHQSLSLSLRGGGEAAGGVIRLIYCGLIWSCRCKLPWPVDIR